MSVDQNDVVDIVSQSRDGRCVLTISDHLPWGVEGSARTNTGVSPLRVLCENASVEMTGSHLEVLQEKLNRYLAFIESGELVEKLPRYKGVPVRISICFKYPPDSTGEKFLELARNAVEGAGFEFEHKVFRAELSN